MCWYLKYKQNYLIKQINIYAFDEYFSNGKTSNGTLQTSQIFRLLISTISICY